MDEPDIVDDVNALLNLGVGDSYRLEHIKQSYIQNKTIWITDQRYLENMKKNILLNILTFKKSLRKKLKILQKMKKRFIVGSVEKRVT